MTIQARKVKTYLCSDLKLLSLQRRSRMLRQRTPKERLSLTRQRQRALLELLVSEGRSNLPEKERVVDQPMTYLPSGRDLALSLRFVP